MNSLLLKKSSSRSGRFKKKLVTEDALLKEAPVISTKLGPFLKLLYSSSITPSDFVACYIITYLSHRYPGNWPGNRRGHHKRPGTPWRELPFSFEPNVVKRLSDIVSLQDIFLNFGLKSTPLSVNRALLGWSAREYHLELMFRIPTPCEVLLQQKQGHRVVTAIIDQRMKSYIMGERDALSFLMHDLIHANHFFKENASYTGQIGLYGLLDTTINYFDLSNPGFAHEFEYIISDMNAYPIHLLKCLKSAMIHYFSEKYYQDWLIPLNPPRALFALNTKSYIANEMDPIILRWLESFRQS